ncbi:MAG: hypothetical protein K0S07_300 [Chlamydiales bacterium]|jgi:chromosome segregation ATPase|nr:hypothetical protein [Chlamydiales bacterium]
MDNQINDSCSSTYTEWESLQRGLSLNATARHSDADKKIDSSTTNILKRGLEQPQQRQLSNMQELGIIEKGSFENKEITENFKKNLNITPEQLNKTREKSNELKSRIKGESEQLNKLDEKTSEIDFRIECQSKQLVELGEQLNEWNEKTTKCNFKFESENNKLKLELEQLISDQEDFMRELTEFRIKVANIKTEIK